MSFGSGQRSKGRECKSLDRFKQTLYQSCGLVSYCVILKPEFENVAPERPRTQIPVAYMV